MPKSLGRPFALLIAIVVLLLVTTATGPASASASTLATSTFPVELNDSITTVELWPGVTMLHDPDGKLSVDEVLAATEKFAVPRSAYATLGLQNKIVWLRARVSVSAQSDGEWILDIDYTLLNRIDIYIASDGKVLRHAILGNAQPWSLRPLTSRSLALPLALQPDRQYEFLLRVDTIGAMILPITLSKPFAFHGRAQNEQMLQGLATSLGLFLLLYSLLQWASVREHQYLKYALLIAGSALFSIHFLVLARCTCGRTTPGWSGIWPASPPSLRRAEPRFLSRTY